MLDLLLAPHTPPPVAVLALTPTLACALAAAAPGWRAARWGSSVALASAGATLAVWVAARLLDGSATSDGVGAALALLVAFVGWVLVRFSANYVAGEPGEHGHRRALLAALAAVQLVVATDHLLLLTLAWTATSLALHRLLRFFPDRSAAVLAAHKKFIVARAADACMLAACGLLWAAFGTLSLTALAARFAEPAVLPGTAQAAAVLVVAAVLLKTAQLPFHGWLIQVMEAPTPVSALLHAGVVNLGALVLIRLAGLVERVPAAAGVLVVAGTLTAVVGALVMTTRISVKVALAWSTAAQMGFMLLQCGLGLWGMALLHLLAHSLYKAHAFLAAGGTVQQTLLRRLAPAPARPLPGAALAAAALALAALAAVAWASGAQPAADPAAWVMAAVLALAVAPLLTPAPATPWPVPAALGAGGAAAAMSATWWALHQLVAPLVPGGGAAAGAWWPVPAAAFAALFLVQTWVAARPAGRLARALYPWAYGGLFLDERFSRWAFRLLPPPAVR